MILCEDNIVNKKDVYLPLKNDYSDCKCYKFNTTYIAYDTTKNNWVFYVDYKNYNELIDASLCSISDTLSRTMTFNINFDRLMVVYKLASECAAIDWHTSDEEIFDILGLDYDRYLTLDLVDSVYENIREELFRDVDMILFSKICQSLD